MRLPGLVAAIPSSAAFCIAVMAAFWLVYCTAQAVVQVVEPMVTVINGAPDLSARRGCSVTRMRWCCGTEVTHG